MTSPTFLALATNPPPFPPRTRERADHLTVDQVAPSKSSVTWGGAGLSTECQREWAV